MKIFSPTVSTSNNAKESAPESGEKKIVRHKREKPKAKPMSENEVREKLAAHVETSSKAKLENQKKSTDALGAGFMNPEANAQIGKAFKENAEKKELSAENEKQKAEAIMSDVQLNDPKDTNTQEKLKTALRTGAFNFNSKEREALEKILSH